MTDPILTLAALWAPLLAVIAILWIARAAKPNLVWLVVALFFFAAYFAALNFLGDFIPVRDYFGALDWNWGGKIAGIATSIVLLIGLWLIGRKPPRESGVTLKQDPGALLPALIATAVLVGASIGLEILFDDGVSTDPERLWFQATMPGLDEELHWRGVFLLAMNEAVRGGRLNVLGAPLSWGGLLTVLLFGLGHGVAVQDGEFGFSLLAIAVTGGFGLGLLWIRERTGSIVIPIIAHNLINFCSSFF